MGLDLRFPGLLLRRKLAILANRQYLRWHSILHEAAIQITRIDQMVMPPNRDEPESDASDLNQPGSSRREFLRGRSALDALRSEGERAAEKLADAVLAENAKQASLQDRQSSYLEQYSKNAMACEFELLFNLHQYPQSGAAAMEAFQLIDLLEDQMTVYRDHSEVSRINRNAFEQELVVERRLFELLELAIQIHQETGQAFDITSSPLTRVWGFDHRQGRMPIQVQIDEALELVGSENLILKPEKSSIRFHRSGVRIDLGGIGKGHALDRVAELFEFHSIGDFVIHGGQSSVLARGSSVCRSGAVKESTTDQDSSIQPGEQNPGWPIGISHPTLPGVRLAEVYLRNRALGTSGTGRQGFYHQGKRYGHIIDPRSGWPASHFLSTTVISDSAAVCDALATAFFVMPFESVVEYCSAHPEISAILVSGDVTQKAQVRLDVLNLADSQWQLMS